MAKDKVRRGRYEKKEKKNNKRKYMSYEEVPLDDIKDDEPEPSNITGKFLKTFLILFLSVVVVIAIMNIEKLTPDNVVHWFQYDLLGKTDGDGYPTPFTGSTVNVENFDLISGVPAYCSDTTIAVLNKNAGKYQENQHSYASPVMSVNGGCGIVYNTDATGYTVFNRDSVQNSSSVKKKIYAADVSANGVYGLVTECDDYLAKLTVYRSDNLEKYEYSFADYYINTVSLNKDGTRAVVSGVSARNGGLISVIYILDFSQSTYYQKYEAENAFIYRVCFLDNGNVVAVGDNSAYFINVGSGRKRDISYSNRKLTAYSLKRDYGMLLSLSVNPDGRECDIMTVDENGNSGSEIHTKGKIISLDIRDDNPAVLIPERIVVYDSSGKKMSEIKVDPDSRKICCAEDNSYYVLGKSRINKVTSG